MTVEYLTGDSLETMRSLPDDSVDLSACSPPFLALRNYNDLDGQWGSEPTPADFLRNLLNLATETRRVLAPHGSLAWELGDTYSGKSGWGDDKGTTRYPNGRGVTSSESKPSASGPGWPLSKSLTGVPTLFAWSLAYGRNLLDPTQTFEPWRIRNIIVWARSNPPVGALGDKVRPATSYITVATPSAKRWFDLDAVRTAHKFPNDDRSNRASIKTADRSTERLGAVLSNGGNPAGAPPTDYWTDEYDAADLTWLVNSQPSKLAHYAMWPPKLAERLILSMSPREVCNSCGEPRRRITGKAEYVKTSDGKITNGDAAWRSGRRGADNSKQDQRNDISCTRNAPTIGWSTCECEDPDYRAGVVLDAFAGTGTTLAVADLHDRDAIGIDLDPNNPTLYDARRKEVKRALFGFKDENIAGQASLFGGDAA